MNTTVESLAYNLMIATRESELGDLTARVWTRINAARRKADRAQKKLLRAFPYDLTKPSLNSATAEQLEITNITAAFPAASNHPTGAADPLSAHAEAQQPPEAELQKVGRIRPLPTPAPHRKTENT